MIDEQTVSALKKPEKPAILRCAGQQFLFICLASLPFLFLCSGFTTRNNHEPSVPLALQLLPAEAAHYQKMLAAGGIRPVAYDEERKTIFVPESTNRRALVVLAMNDALPEKSREFFQNSNQNTNLSWNNATLNRVMYVSALQGEVALILQSIDGVRTARVVYPDSSQEPLSAEPAPLRAAVEVVMLPGKALDQKTAMTIQRLVTFCFPGLEQKNVTVWTEQSGS